MEVKLYWNDDHTEYAVLVSYGFGAGWSTWESRELAYDSRVVEFFFAHQYDKEWMRTVNDSGLFAGEKSAAYEEAEQFFKSIGYDNMPYMGGFSQIGVDWVYAGVPWRIDEYDGAESLVMQQNDEWTCFN